MNSIKIQTFPNFETIRNDDPNAKRIWYNDSNEATYLIASGAATIANFLGEDWESVDHIDTDTKQTVYVGVDNWDTYIKPDNDLAYFRKKNWAQGIGLTFTSYRYYNDAFVMYPIFNKNGAAFGRGSNLGDSHCRYTSKSDIRVIKINDNTMLFFSYDKRSSRTFYPILITRGYNKVTKEWHDYICLVMPDYIRWIDATSGAIYTASDANGYPRSIFSFIGERGAMLAPFQLLEAGDIEFPDVKIALYGYANFNKLIKIKDRWYNTTILADSKLIYLDVTDYVD